mmetsp:Transcript_19524/g.54312  ORF Transcript_19524/g.54312 Transcript_19524/m.54312 type:complete len:223 (-) Transcript_19524:48-716(-)
MPCWRQRGSLWQGALPPWPSTLSWALCCRWPGCRWQRPGEGKPASLRQERLVCHRRSSAGVSPPSPDPSQCRPLSPGASSRGEAGTAHRSWWRQPGPCPPCSTLPSHSLPAPQGVWLPSQPPTALPASPEAATGRSRGSRGKSSSPEALLGRGGPRSALHMLAIPVGQEPQRCCCGWLQPPPLPWLPPEKSTGCSTLSAHSPSSGAWSPQPTCAATVVALRP